MNEANSSVNIASEPSEAGLTRGGEVPERMNLRACAEVNDTEATSTIPERTIETITGEIRVLKTEAVVCFLEIGRRLCEAKDMLPHGEFGAWLEREVQFSQSTANNYMKLFKAYGNPQSSFFGAEVNSQAIENLSVTNALKLLAVPEDEREDFVRDNDVEHLSSREMDKLIKEKEELQKKLDVEREASEGAGLAMAEAQEKADAAQKQAELSAGKVQELQKQLEELKNRPIDVAVQQPDPAEQQAAIDAAVDAALKKASEIEAGQREKAIAEKTKELAEAAEKANKAREAAAAAQAKAEAQKERAERAAEKAKEEADAAARAREEAEKKLADAAKSDAMNDAAVQQFKSLFETAQGILAKLDALAGQAEQEGKPQLRQALRAVCGQYAGGGEDER